MSEVDEQRGDGEVGRCHVCGSEFVSQDALSKHLMDAHDEDCSQTRIKRFKSSTGPGVSTV